MRRLALKTGGRPRSLDDLQILQSLADKSGSAFLKGRGAFVLSGCQVSGLSIAPGFVYIGGTIIEFPGASVSSFPAYFKAALIEDTALTYEDGNSKPTQSLSVVEIVYELPSGIESIPFTAGGGRSYFDAISDSVVLTRGNQIIAGLKSFSEKIVSAGISLVDEIAAIKMPGWVTTARIADGNVTTIKLADYAVSPTKLGDAAVTNSKIAESAVTESKISNQSISNAKLAEQSVSTGKIVDRSVTMSKLSDDVRFLFGGNDVSTTYNVNWVGNSNASSRVYSYTWYYIGRVDQMRPYVKLSFYAARDSGGTDVIECYLQRSSSPTFSSPANIAVRTFRLDDGSWQYCSMETVDVGIFNPGTYYYRIVCTNISGGNNNFSNSYESTIFSVPYK